MSKLESWLRNKNMTTNTFAELIKCSRSVIWKVKRDMPIDPKIAKRIEAMTDSLVIPETHPVGKPRL
jgi:hypothetical protein